MASAAKVVHWPTGSGGWASALTQYAKSTSPSTSLPEGVYLRSDAQTLAIYDGFPKARYHFLVLPRLPFPLASDANNRDVSASSSSSPGSTFSVPKLALAGGKLALGSTRKQDFAPASHLRSLNNLLASPYAAPVLSALRAQSKLVVDLIKEEMRHTSRSVFDGEQSDNEEFGKEWGVRVGFHAVPSMETVHLHVISNDLVSERLKNKKHYLSFHPTHGFWLDLSYVEDLVKQGKKSLPHPSSFYDRLLKMPLTSFRDGSEYRNMPLLKQHLELAWKNEITATWKDEKTRKRHDGPDAPVKAMKIDRR